MLKKTITYTDYDGNERTESFYFNFTEAELQEWNLSTPGGLAGVLEKIIQSKDVPKMAEYFKEILLKAYGEKSEDGRRFIKSKELSEAFTQTEAYSQLFMSLLSDEGEAANFVNGLIPASMRNAQEKQKLKEVA